MTSNTSTVTPKSLAGFEDDDTEDIPVLPRPRTTRPAPPPSGEESPGARSVRPQEASAPVQTPKTSQGKLTPAGSQSGAKTGKSRPATVETGEQNVSPDRIRASNVHVPSTLVDRLEAKCRETKLSRGELIIKAIESTADRLEELVNPAATVGGTLFDARPSARAAAGEGGHKSPVNYRLREKDFAVLDTLVERFKAPSRNHLIVAALTGYLTN